MKSGSTKRRTMVIQSSSVDIAKNIKLTNCDSFSFLNKEKSYFIYGLVES